MATNNQQKSDTEAPAKVEEVTIDSLKKNTEAGLENARAIFFKQMGAAELVASLKEEGYKIVRDEDSEAGD